jgi:hypothetical protein
VDLVEEMSSHLQALLGKKERERERLLCTGRE